MDIQDDNIKFAEFNEKINSLLFDTDHEVITFQNLARELFIQDMKVAFNEEKLIKLWQKYITAQFQEQKLRNSISVSDFNINQVTYIVENLEQQIKSCSNDSTEFIRESIYSKLESLFLSICYMQDTLDSIWNDEQFTEENSKDPLKNIKYLLHKQNHILDNIQHKIKLMETEIENIKKYYPSYPKQI